MQKVMIGLQFSALIPLLIVIIFKPQLNIFFKLLFASILLSVAFDIIGTSCSFIFKNNLAVLCLYNLLNTILLTFLWQKIPFYSIKHIRLVRYVGLAFLSIMIFTMLYFKFSTASLYILSCLSVILGLIFALQYYYQKILASVYTPLLDDPYFITATGYILFSLSTIIILAAQIHYEGQPFMRYTWLLRQIFYLVYNIIIGYAFYVLHKTQSKLQ